MAGYSGKPLAEKLGLKPEMNAAAIAPPTHYGKLLGKVAAPGAFGRSAYNFIHLFARDTDALKKDLPRALKRLAPGGRIWVSWPKKTSAMFKDLTEDGIRAIALPLGIVDVKVCAVDDDWSGLMFLWRKAP
jgi:hypothetical protein